MSTARLLGLALLAAGLASHAGWVSAEAPAQLAPAPHVVRHADFAMESASGDARHVADWIVDSHDNQQLPFLIVDKKSAKVFVFDAGGQLQGAAPVLLGMAPGDDTAPGIGQRDLASIKPSDRTTPAGRFVGALAHNLKGVGILWVDYDAAISLHRVVTSDPKQRRAERLASPTIADNRISFGCINVPPKFYDQFIETAFKKSNGIVYVLPESRSMRQTFSSYDVADHARELNAAAEVAAAAVAAAAAAHAGAAPADTTIRLR